MKTNLSVNSPKISSAGIKKIPFALASHAFLIIMASIFIYGIIGLALFYQYTMTTTPENLQASVSYTAFENGAYQNILKIWQAKQQNLQQNSGQTYPNPFIAGSNK